jgi:hypothetical protein
MTRAQTEEVIACIARKLPPERLAKLLASAYAIQGEDPADLRQGESERTARARVKQAEIEQLRAAGKTREAERLEREL